MPLYEKMADGHVRKQIPKMGTSCYNGNRGRNTEASFPGTSNGFGNYRKLE